MRQVCLLQVTLREYFGIPAPVQAHRADQDVMILVKIVDNLLQLGVHGSLQEAVEASLRDNCAFAQHYSAALRKRTGAQPTSAPCPCSPLLRKLSMTLKPHVEGLAPTHMCKGQRKHGDASAVCSHLQGECKEKRHGKDVECSMLAVSSHVLCAAGPTRAQLTAQSARKAAEEGIIGDEDPLLAVSACPLLLDV